MCVGKNTAQAANVRRSKKCCAVRCSGLHLFEKMLAFLREAVDFVDSLRAGASAPARLHHIQSASRFFSVAGSKRWMRLLRKVKFSLVP